MLMTRKATFAPSTNTKKKTSQIQGLFFSQRLTVTAP